MLHFSSKTHWVPLESDEGHELIETIYEPIIEDYGVTKFEEMVSPSADALESLIEDVRVELRSLNVSIEPVWILEKGPLLKEDISSHIEGFKRLAESHEGIDYHCSYMIFLPNEMVFYTPILNETIKIYWDGSISEYIS